MLLHGLTASGDTFGARYDRLAMQGQLLIPDLLGFGRSMDERRSDFSLEAHLDALDRMIESSAPGESKITVAGHSLGGLLALHWAARRSDVVRVVCFSAPLYHSSSEADARIRGMGWMERLFALEGPLAKAACAWMCRHRGTAQWVTVALEPRWPVPIARMGVRHTWLSYLGAMNGVIRHGGWESALQDLEAAGVPVLLANGARDPVPVPGRAAGLALRHGNLEAVEHPTADHDLPISHPVWCVRALAG
ncbi:MAG: alpha/beta fold hydrolase [Solirubrobacteraceae bacterium]